MGLTLRANSNSTIPRRDKLDVGKKIFITDVFYETEPVSFGSCYRYRLSVYNNYRISILSVMMSTITY